MGRMLLLFGLLLLGLCYVQAGGSEFLRIEDERIMWAALLPGVYAVGMVLLRD